MYTKLPGLQGKADFYVEPNSAKIDAANKESKILL